MVVLLTPGGRNMCLQFGAREFCGKSFIFLQITAWFSETRSPKNQAFAGFCCFSLEETDLTVLFLVSENLRLFRCLKTIRSKINFFILLFIIVPCSVDLYRHKNAENRSKTL